MSVVDHPGQPGKAAMWFAPAGSEVLAHPADVDGDLITATEDGVHVAPAIPVTLGPITTSVEHSFHLEPLDPPKETP